MAPLITAMGKKNVNGNTSEKADFSSIISFLGADIRKDKKRRRGDAEKKRRDRINKCLDQLEELIPYVRQKKLCSKVDKAEVLELTVHFVKEALFEKELSFRKSQMTSVADYERLKWMGNPPDPVALDYERKMAAARKTPEKCSCGCTDNLDKRGHHASLSSYSSYPGSPPHITSPLHRMDFK